MVERLFSKRGENKEVRYSPTARSMTDVLTSMLRPLCVIRVLIHSQINAVCFIHCFDTNYPTRDNNIVKNGHSDDVHGD